MNKRLFVAMLALIMVVFSGCQLAKPEVAAGQDRMVGVLVTTEYLDLLDLEGYLNDHAWDLLDSMDLSGADLSQYQGRLYGELTSTGFDPHDEEQNFMQYALTFPVEGFYFVGMYLSASGNWGPEEETYHSSFGNGGFSDVVPSLNVSDEGTDMTIRATIAFCQEGNITYYANPIYQTADGRVYATAGMGFTADLAGGGEMSTTQSVTCTTTREGKEVTETTTVTVRAIYALPTRELTILQMDENNNLLTRETYPLDSIPEAVDLNSETAYLIVETTDGQKTDRQLCQKSDASVKYYISQGRIAMPAYVQLNWGE